MELLSGLLETDARTAIPWVMGFGAIVLAVQASMGLFSEARTQQIVNRRLKFKDQFASTGELMVELRKQRALNADGGWSLSAEWFNRLVTRSGLVFRPWRWAAMSFAGSAVAAGVFWKYVGNIPATVGIFVALFVLVPLMVLSRKASKRAAKLAQQLPDALAIACRSLEAGHPVAAAIALVAREMPDPIGTEFGMAADEVAYGFSLTHAVQRMAERAGDPDIELFAATVRLQERTGGNLCELLKANQNTIRERQTMRLKVRAASSEGRASAMILTSAPFIVMLGIHLMRPEFYGDVMHSPIIQYGFAGLGAWMFIGNMIMRSMINFKI